MAGGGTWSARHRRGVVRWRYQRGDRRGNVEARGGAADDRATSADDNRATNNDDLFSVQLDIDRGCTANVVGVTTTAAHRANHDRSGAHASNDAATVDGSAGAVSCDGPPRPRRCVLAGGSRKLGARHGANGGGRALHDHRHLQERPVEGAGPWPAGRREQWRDHVVVDRRHTHDTRQLADRRHVLRRRPARLRRNDVRRELSDQSRRGGL